jgi:hypothetical protein
MSLWQVNFAYEEEKVKKNALVKLRLCPECGQKLNYKHLKRLRKEEVRLIANDPLELTVLSCRRRRNRRLLG